MRKTLVVRPALAEARVTLMSSILVLKVQVLTPITATAILPRWLDLFLISALSRILFAHDSLITLDTTIKLILISPSHTPNNNLLQPCLPPRRKPQRPLPSPPLSSPVRPAALIVVGRLMIKDSALPLLHHQAHPPARNLPHGLDATEPSPLPRSRPRLPTAVPHPRPTPQP